MAQNKINACYIYQGNGLTLREEDVKKLTHLNVAFATQSDDLEIHSDHLNLAENIKLWKGWNPELKVLVSIGSGGQKAFSFGASTEENRQKVASGLAAMVERYDLDGVDYDWEYPCCPSNRIASSPTDKENFTLLCQAVRSALDHLPGRHRLFTIAAGGDPYYLDFTEMDKVHQSLDYVFLMTYDLRCGFHSLTGHHTNLYRATGDLFRTSAKDSVDQYMKAGVPAEKLVLGAAFYSRQWLEAPDINHGFLQYVRTNGGYGPSYTEILERYMNQNGFIRYWDDESKAPYLFDGSTFISYDDPDSIAAKCEYINQMGLAGIFSWEYNNDNTGALLDAMYQGVRNA